MPTLGSAKLGPGLGLLQWPGGLGRWTVEWGWVSPGGRMPAGLVLKVQVLCPWNSQSLGSGTWEGAACLPCLGLAGCLLGTPLSGQDPSWEAWQRAAL